ncbi:DUF4097 family beta strand repeat-containing protein [Agarilytica rhodophyticola]|uniref:DUF4097 family beta strand repeat-containing protein n=1 Tax=Agarilytica rhodophyticola TaxID=1737490 RepID=UPI000B3411CB|nr:hypothetical protein [Agarilytica rhodophyticola]
MSSFITLNKITVFALIFILSSYANAEVLEKTFDVNKGGTFVLDSSKGSVKISSWNKKTVEVAATKKSNYESELSSFVISMTKKGNKIIVKGEGGRRSGVNVGYNVKVPKDFNLDLQTGVGSIKIGDLKGNISAKTSAGSIKIDNVDGDINVNTSGGSISVGEVTGKVITHTSGGSIKIEKGGKIVDADTSGGSIKIGSSSGDVNADTSGGSIRVGYAKGNISVDTSGGSIKIEGSDGNVSADTSGGNISIENVAGAVSADTSGGGIKITGVKGAVSANTSGGNILVEFIAGKPKGKAPISLDTKGGSISLYLSKDIKASVVAEVDGGRRSNGGPIHSDFPLQMSSSRGGATAKGDINGGGNKINLSASNGTINIKLLN